MKHLTCVNKNRKLKCILYSYFCHYRLIISQFWNWSRITFYFYTNTDEIFGFFIDVITHLPKRKELERYIMPLLVWNEKPTFLACLKLVEQCSKLPKISSNIFSPRNKFLPLAKVFKSLLCIFNNNSKYICTDNCIWFTFYLFKQVFYVILIPVLVCQGVTVKWKV